MKTYFTIIAKLQGFLMGLSVLLLLVLPVALAFFPDQTTALNAPLYNWSYDALVFVMVVRPLADLLSKFKWIRPLVILRKGFGTFSASIIVSFIFAKVIIDPSAYFSAFTTLKYWSLANNALFAHLADIAAFLLLITSNKLSKKILGRGWKRVQRLSYVYFFGSSLYLLLTYNEQTKLYYMILVSSLTLLAFIKNYYKEERLKIRR